MTVPADAIPAIRFRSRHDMWDAVDFYLYFVVGTHATGLFFIVQGWSLLDKAPFDFRPWLLLVFGFVYFAAGAIMLARHVWRRFAETYELTPTEFVIDYGYKNLRVTYADISGVHPNKICRMTTALKPALRVRFRRSVDGDRGFDVAVVNPDVFLDELGTRCPHLRREGPRLVPAE